MRAAKEKWLSMAKQRRQRLLQFAAAAGFLVIVAVAVLIVINSGGSGGDTNLEGKAEVSRLLKGIPQREMDLGSEKAPIELVEFGDLQCPVCKGYSEHVLPSIIESEVRQGQLRIDFHNFVIIGKQSISAGAAALAAGEQGRGWNYIELFYRNQGEENSGYADDEFLKAIAEGAGVKNIPQWEKERRELTSEVGSTTSDAESLGFEGTPSFVLLGPGIEGGFKTIETPDPGALEDAIEEAIEKAS
jgi:protein-disulfide isomerase